MNFLCRKKGNFNFYACALCSVIVILSERRHPPYRKLRDNKGRPITIKEDYT